MKNIKTITLVTIMFGLLVFALTILDFAALHDIKREYISSDILEYLNISLSEKPPEWTSTAGEWQLVTFSLISRLFYCMLNIFVLIILYRKVLPGNNR